MKENEIKIKRKFISQTEIDESLNDLMQELADYIECEGPTSSFIVDNNLYRSNSFKFLFRKISELELRIKQLENKDVIVEIVERFEKYSNKDADSK